MREPGLLLAAVLGAAVQSLAASARADGQPVRVEDDGSRAFGHAGQLVVGLPRLLPVVAVNSWRVQSSSAGDAPTGTWVSFGNHPSGLEVYDLPRLGLAAFATDRLVLGVDLAGFATLGASPTPGNPYVRIVGAAPHVGYLAPLGGVSSLWMRAGVAYYLLDERGVDALPAGAAPWSFTWRQLDADLEAHLVLAALPHVAVTVGLVVELPLAGHVDETGAGAAAIDASASWVHVGFVGGLLTYL